MGATPAKYHKALIPLLSLVLSLVVGAAVIQLCGYPAMTAYREMAAGAFGSVKVLVNTLEKSVPLLFTGLAVAVALKGGMFNIGCEGQLYLGAMAYALCGIYLKGLPGPVHVLACCAAAISAGALWAGLAALLKMKRGAHEVVTTIMLNYIAQLFTGYLVSGPLKAEGIVPQTVVIAPTAAIGTIFPGGRITWGFVLALVSCALIWFLYRWLPAGYEMTAAGINPKAAEAGGVKPDSVRMRSMLLSGGLAAMAGAMMVGCTYGRFMLDFSPGYGFDGIAIAVLGQSSPVGILLAGVLFGGLRTGSLSMSMFAGIPAEVITILQGVMILTISAPAIFDFLRKRRVKA